MEGNKIKKFFRYQYSFFLVPIIFILFLISDKKNRYIYQYLLFLIGVVGIIITIIARKNFTPLYTFLYIFLHLPTFIWVFYDYKNNLKININILILFFIINLGVFYIPLSLYPYITITKPIMINVINFVNILYILLFYLIKK